jgi:anaerobic magnesium-protoporphyrin IX monomethyl ester cyclase
LIAGLPGEDFEHFLESIDWVRALGNNHLQIEPVKLLPGAPLRNEVARWNIQFNPDPPYTILSSEQMSFVDLERLRGIGRLLDLLVNSQRFNHLLETLQLHFGRISLLLVDLDDFWREQGFYRQSFSLSNLYLMVDRYLCQRFSGRHVRKLRELLARDYAHHQRVVAGNVPDFFDIELSEDELTAVRKRVKREVETLERSGKIQYFSAVFHDLDDQVKRKILIFLYQSRAGSGLKTREICL